MKKLLLFLNMLFFLALNSFSQTPPVKILIGEDETKVREYFHSLKQNFLNNPYVKVEQSVGEAGNLILTFSSPLEGEEKTSSLSIWAVFMRMEDKSEICIKQAILGSNVSAYKNVSFIKDNFKELSSNTWIKPHLQNGKEMVGFKVLAEFKKGDNGSYNIVYQLTDRN